VVTTGFLSPSEVGAARSDDTDRAVILRRDGKFACKFRNNIRKYSLENPRQSFLDRIFGCVAPEARSTEVSRGIQLFYNLVDNFGCLFPLYVSRKSYNNLRAKFSRFS